MWNMIQVLDVADRWRFRRVIKVTVESSRDHPIDRLTAVLPLLKDRFDPEQIRKAIASSGEPATKNFTRLKTICHRIRRPRAGDWNADGRRTNKSEEALKRVEGVVNSARAWEIVAVDPMDELKWIDVQKAFANPDQRVSRLGVPTSVFTQTIRKRQVSRRNSINRGEVNPSDGIYLPASSGKSVLYSLWKLRKVGKTVWRRRVLSRWENHSQRCGRS